MTVVLRTTAVATNKSMAAPTVNDLKTCMDTPASRRPKSIRVVSAAIAIDSLWAAVMNIAATVMNTGAVAKDTGAVAGKTSAMSAAATATQSAARALSVVTTNRGVAIHNDPTIRAAIARANDTPNVITTTTAIVTSAAAKDPATKDAAGWIALQMRWRRGLVTKTPSAGVTWTNSANTADADRKAIGVLTNALKKTSTIAWVMTTISTPRMLRLW